MCKANESTRRKGKQLFTGDKVREAHREQQHKYTFKKAAKNAIKAAINKFIVGSSTPYNATGFLGKAVKKAEGNLSLSPQKRITVIKKLAMNSIISLHNPLVKTKKTTTNNCDHIEQILKNFYARDNITQQAPGKQDTAVVRKQ